MSPFSHRTPGKYSYRFQSWTVRRQEGHTPITYFNYTLFGEERDWNCQGTVGRKPQIMCDGKTLVTFPLKSETG